MATILAHHTATGTEFQCAGCGASWHPLGQLVVDSSERGMPGPPYSAMQFRAQPRYTPNARWSTWLDEHRACAAWSVRETVTPAGVMVVDRRRF